MTQPVVPSGLKLSPIGDKRPPAIIPLANIPQHLFSGLQIPGQRTPLVLGQPSVSLTTQSYPGTIVRSNQESMNLLQRQSFTSHLPIPTLMSAPAVLQPSSPEETDEEKFKGQDSRHNRRREMNRIAQQKSRLKKDQKITDLQTENDQLKAKIISLEAEVKVWKNMSKKSENEANELRKKFEEQTERFEEDRRHFINSKVFSMPDEPTTIKTTEEENTMDGLKIDENVESTILDCLDAQEKVQSSIVEPNVQLESNNNNMLKEIQSLTTELDRMYKLTTQQAEQNKLLHQALADQEERHSLRELKEEMKNLEMRRNNGMRLSKIKKRKPWARSMTKKDIEKIMKMARRQYSE